MWDNKVTENPTNPYETKEMEAEDMELTTTHGYNLYDISSMLQKAIRRADVYHAAYAAAEMHPKFRTYLWKRLLTVSAEDCYGIITKEIIALQQADEFVNGKKGDNWLFIAKAVTLLCMARKNRYADYVTCNFMCPDRNLSPEEIKEFDFNELHATCQLPDWVYDVHTRTGKMMGKTKIDMIRDEQAALTPHQTSLFDDGDWGQFVESERAEGHMSRREEAQYKPFAAGKKRYY